MLTPEPIELELAAFALRQRADQLRADTTGPEAAARRETAAQLDNVADWLSHRAAHATIP